MRKIKRILILVVVVYAINGFIQLGYYINPGPHEMRLRVDENLYHTSLSRCVDGDTAVFSVDGEDESVRFLAIDTPEMNFYSDEKPEAYAQKASDYTCDRLKETRGLQLEFELDSNGEYARDPYGRLLAMVFVDGSLLQIDLLEKGYAKIAYANRSTPYYDDLVDAEESAKRSSLGIWK